MIKQREQRCGKVIWTTMLQIVYMFLYLCLIIYRYPIGDMYSMNYDAEEIIWRHQFSLSLIEGDTFQVYIEDV